MTGILLLMSDVTRFVSQNESGDPAAIFVAYDFSIVHLPLAGTANGKRIRSNGNAVNPFLHFFINRIDLSSPVSGSVQPMVIAESPSGAHRNVAADFFPVALVAT